MSSLRRIWQSGELPARLVTTAMLRAVLSPMIYAKYREGLPTRLTSATPTDEPRGACPGPDPDRILVIGGISGAAVGVSSFRLGVACSSAEALSRLSGRGAEWTSMAVPIVRSGMTTRYLTGLPDLHRFDAIVFFPGVSGALSLTSPRRWSRDLERTVAQLVDRSASDATILVADVPHVADRVQAPRFVRSVVRQHTTVLNALTEQVVARSARARMTYMPSIDRRMVVDGVFSYTRLYRIWGTHVGQCIAAERGYTTDDEDAGPAQVEPTRADDGMTDRGD